MDLKIEEMNPSLKPSLNSYETMEARFQSVKTALPPITWESVLYWAEVTDAFENLTVTLLTQEEATKLWEEYAYGNTLGPDGILQSDEFETSFGLSPLQGVSDSGEQEDG